MVRSLSSLPLLLLAMAAYLLALFAKTTACTLPAALVLVVWLTGRRFSWWRAAQVAPFVLLGVAMGLVSVWWEGNLGSATKRRSCRSVSCSGC